MHTPILDGIQKHAILDIVLPGAYGYYAHTRGGKLSDTALKGALIGGGVETVSSIGDVLSGDIDLKTLTSPFKGALTGGVSAMGGHVLVPLIMNKLRNIDWSKSGRKTLRQTQKLLDRLGDAVTSTTN